MTPELTPAQRLAATTRGTDLLVSAAAGSGKTMVLVERVIHLVTGPDAVDVDRLLVVTFTEAAADEMRERIGRALRDRLAALERSVGQTGMREADRLRLQTALLGRATISTIHSFCLSVCRRYFHRLSLDPAFEVLSEEEASLLREEVLEEVFESLYAAGDPGFLGLVEAYGTERGDESLARLVLRVHGLARNDPDPAGWLRRAAEAFRPPEGVRVLDLEFGRRALEGVRLRLLEALESLHLARSLAARDGGPTAYGAVLDADISRLEEAAAACDSGSWKAVVEAVRAAGEFGTLPRVGRDEADEALKEDCRKARERAKSIVRELGQTCAGRSEEALLRELRRLAEPMEALAGLASRFDRAYSEAKRERGVVDFNDLEHLCLEVLREGPPSDAPAEPSEAALDLRRRYEEVLVDEYQDINPVQEEILRLVSRGDNLFMVGDVKQSIYRFRRADPTLFARKLETFLPLGDRPAAGPAGGRRTSLPDNFRSRRPVVDAVNFVFRRVMRKETAEIDYGPDAELRCGAAALYGEEGAGGPPVELHLVERRGV
ncbi:MAG TPA: hypothetical protein DHW14_01890, partial [Clostridiales bacterium]|nr:hypothetical protein [Clostridiales bacterium]